jgi:TolB-like protein/tetratricopeptide (TPR) repeat protein
VRIAVVPFDPEENDSPEYLGVGLAADVTTRLGVLGEGGIAPLARQSARRLGAEHGDPLPLARELALDFLVTGRMRAKNGELRVVVEVVQVSDQSLLWSEAFSSSEDGAETLAGTIAEVLASRFGRPAPTAPDAVDPRAYRALLQGEFLSQTRSERGIRQSIGCFQKALEWEPEWAHAHAALAHAFLYLGLRGYARPRDVAPPARSAAARAMQCRHGSVSVLRSLAHLRWALDWLPDEALELLARAERLAPHDDQVTHLRGMILGALGRFEEALPVLERARETNPFAPNHVVTRINTLVFAGRIEEASLEARQLADVQPELASAHALRAVTAVLAARPDDAVGAAEITDRLARSDQLARSAAGWALARCGQESASRAILAAFERSGARRYVGMSFPAAVHVGLGEHAAALACLERAVEERCMWLPYVGVDPRFAPLRDDARFREIVAGATGGQLRLG